MLVDRWVFLPKLWCGQAEGIYDELGPRLLHDVAATHVRLDNVCAAQRLCFIGRKDEAGSVKLEAFAGQASIPREGLR